jgi:hypothetical protein
LTALPRIHPIFTRRPPVPVKVNSRSVATLARRTLLTGQLPCLKGFAKIDDSGQSAEPPFPPAQRARLFTAVASCLAPHGTLRQWTIMPWVYQRLYWQNCEKVRFRLVLPNLPPGGVYACQEFRSRSNRAGG